MVGSCSGEERQSMVGWHLSSREQGRRPISQMGPRATRMWGVGIIGFETPKLCGSGLLWNQLKLNPDQVGYGFLGSKCTDPMLEAVAVPGEAERRCTPSRTKTQPQQTQRSSGDEMWLWECLSLCGKQLRRTQAINELANSASAIKENVRSMSECGCE